MPNTATGRLNTVRRGQPSKAPPKTNSATSRSLLFTARPPFVWAAAGSVRAAALRRRPDYRSRMWAAPMSLGAWRIAEQRSASRTDMHPGISPVIGRDGASSNWPELIVISYLRRKPQWDRAAQSLHAVPPAMITEEDQMMGMRERLEKDLTVAVNRLRQMGGIALDEVPGPAGDNTPFADEVDEIVASEEREIMFGTRELLVDRVNRITAALDRLSAGEYGICIECGETIAPARLRALPEVQTDRKSVV